MGEDVATLIKSLRGLEPEECYSAAQSLRAMDPVPLEALDALVDRMEDRGVVTLHEYADWDGRPMSGDYDTVRDVALEALVKLGTKAFVALVYAMEVGEPTDLSMLNAFLEKVRVEVVCAAGLPVIERARLLPGLYPRGEEVLELARARLAGAAM
ncbi:MAG TPA: hypothetical protein VGM39_13265 [Kofleriaceae bacterium]|jgi:hypothetical protein